MNWWKLILKLHNNAKYYIPCAISLTGEWDGGSLSTVYRGSAACCSTRKGIGHGPIDAVGNSQAILWREGREEEARGEDKTEGISS